MTTGGNPSGPTGSTGPRAGSSGSAWDGVPEAIEVDLTKLGEQERINLFKEYIDEGRANQLVARMDGSASDYESNMRRINNVLGWLNFAMDGALKIGRIVT